MILFDFIKAAIQESLSKDVERFELAQDFYTFILKTLKNNVKLVRPGDTNTLLVGEDYELLVEFVEDIMIRVIMDFNRIPSTLKSQFVGKYVDDQIVKVGTVDIMILPRRTERDKMRGGFYTEPQFIKATNQLNTGITVLVNEDDLPKSSDHYDVKISTIFNIFHKNKSTIMHELAHMFDDISLMGTKKFRSKDVRNSIDKDGNHYGKKYYNSGIEVNARWASVIASLSNFQYSDYDNTDNDAFEDFILPMAKKEIHFDKLSLPKQKKFILRLWEFFKSGPYPLPEKFVETEARELNEIYIDYLRRLSDRRSYPRSEYSKQDIINHADWYQYYYDILRENRYLYDDNVNMSHMNDLTNCKTLLFLNKYFSDENSKKIINRAKELHVPYYEKFVKEVSASF